MPQPQVCAAPDPSGGVEAALCCPCTVCRGAVCAGYSHEFESSAHWSSLICICLSWLFEAPPCLLGWKGEQRRFCHGGIPSPTANFQLHLWDWKMALGTQGTLFPPAVAGGCGRSAITADIPHFRGTSQCFLLVFLPSFTLSTWGV